MSFPQRLTRTSLRNVGAALALYLAIALFAPKMAFDLAPALLLALVLLFGYTPGERVVQHFAERRRRRIAGRSRAVKRIALPTVDHVFSQLIQRLIAFALAMRPPPVLAATS
ncbi:MAG: hypothetical protein ACPGYP_10290 [Solirubrobacterales bacterium]